ncbi:MAG TPA: hypothetical protein VFT22_02575 [Kofleriaceae bacterium]|nr:hypothetical protein [Kofleriaceae bacterium]
MSRYTYFMISPDSVPAAPAYPVWFSVWTRGASTTLTWSQKRPSEPSESLPLWVIGRVEDTDPPQDAEVTWLGSKCIPPPEMKVSPTISLDDFKTRFAQYLTSRGV